MALSYLLCEIRPHIPLTVVTSISMLDISYPEFDAPLKNPTLATIFALFFLMRHVQKVG